MESSNTIPRLKVRNADGEETIVHLQKDIFTIGRLGENDLKISDAHVSRRHAEILREGDTYRIIDKNSKMGTFVNGERVTSHVLHHGDQIMLGRESKEIQFLLQEAEPSTAVSFETKAFFRDESYGDLHRVSRFLEGVRYFTAGAPLQEILDLMLDMALEISGAERAFLVLVDENQQPSFRSGRNRSKESLQADQFQISRSILREVIEKGKSVVRNLDSHPEALANLQSAAELELRTVVCLPLRGLESEAKPSKQVIGALYMDSKLASKGLSTISEGLLVSLARDSGAVLENVRLLKESREKKVLEMELQTAREIQESLLPEIQGSYQFFEACAENLPSRRISGDYYDLFPMPGGRYVLVIADISGKGVPAAILTSLVQGALIMEMSRSDDILACIGSLNLFLVRRSNTNRFVSLFLAMLEPNGTMSYVNAGHNPPILIHSSGEMEELAARGMVLGVLENPVFEKKVMTLTRGDIICLYTDGVTDAQSETLEFFGEERLLDVLSKAPRESASDVLNTVLRKVTEHIGAKQRNDDLTLVVIRHC